MSVASSLLDRVDHFAISLEQLIVDGGGEFSSLREELPSLSEEARFFQADAISDVLSELEPLLDDRDAREVLPLLFQLRDAVSTLREGDGARSTADPFLEFDFQEEIDDVLTLSEEAQRTMNSRVAAGQSLYLVVLRVRPDVLDEVEALLEAHLPLLTYRRQDRTARLALVVLDNAAPAVGPLLEDAFQDGGVVREVSVRQLQPGQMRGTRSIADGWYAQMPEISLAADPAALERISILLDIISPDAAGEALPALWTELQSSITATLTVDLRSLVSGMRDALEAMAVEAGTQVHLNFTGTVGSVGAEIAENLRRVLFELLANAIIHGIEAPEARRNAGKAPAGEIRCVVYEEGDGLSIRVHDDGAGFNGREARRAADGGLRRARRIVQELLGGALRVKSGGTGTTAVIALPARRGIYRALVATRANTSVVIPSGLVEWAGELVSDRVVVDATRARFLRYQRQLVPLVEPEISGRSASDTAAGDGLEAVMADDPADTPRAASAVSAPPAATAVIRIAGVAVALALDEIGHETLVAARGDGRVRLEADPDSWGHAVVLQNLPIR